MKLAIKCQDILFVDDLLDDLKAGSNKCVQPLLQNASGNKPRGREAPIFWRTIGNLTPSFGGRLNPSSSRYPRHSLGAVTSVTPAPVAARGREWCVYLYDSSALRKTKHHFGMGDGRGRR